MKYQGSPTFSHSQQDKIGILLTNLGTPDAPVKGALRRYLKQFLSDPRVVEVPRLLWTLILNVVILNIRPARSAEAYEKVWTERGSPLMYHTQDQSKALGEKLKQQFGEDILVDFAMRYGSPSVDSVITKMLNKGVRKLLVLPLYPQYCASTSASTFDAVAESFKSKRWLPELRFVSHYHDFPHYIQAVADSIRAHWQSKGRADKLIFSYHGIPLRYLLQGDPYHCECYLSARLVAENLGLEADQYLVSFQSRFGREEWLKPYTDHILKALPAQGIKSVQVVCPGFSADCLETIEEIGMENREYFISAGGEKYEYIAALNADDRHIDALAKLVEQHMQGWERPHTSALRAKLACALGAKS